MKGKCKRKEKGSQKLKMKLVCLCTICIFPSELRPSCIIPQPFMLIIPRRSPKPMLRSIIRWWRNRCNRRNWSGHFLRTFLATTATAYDTEKYRENKGTPNSSRQSNDKRSMLIDP